MKHGGQKRSESTICKPNLFSQANRPAEIESAGPSVADEQVLQDSEPLSLGPAREEFRPEQKLASEDDFMLDSLNDQKAHQQIGKDNDVASTKEAPRDSESNFMSALQDAISHFEGPFSLVTSHYTAPLASTIKRQDGTKKRTAHKESPSFSYNSSSATAANSTGEVRRPEGELQTENESLKHEYNALMARYCELKSSNKVLMNDYAVLRSQLEELKAVPTRNRHGVDEAGVRIRDEAAQTAGKRRRAATHSYHRTVHA